MMGRRRGGEGEGVGRRWGLTFQKSHVILPFISLILMRRVISPGLTNPQITNAKSRNPPPPRLPFFRQFSSPPFALIAYVIATSLPLVIPYPSSFLYSILRCPHASIHLHLALSPSAAPSPSQYRWRWDLPLHPSQTTSQNSLRQTRERVGEEGLPGRGGGTSDLVGGEGREKGKG